MTGDGDARVLVFDVGLSNVKAVLFALDGSIVERASTPYPTYRSGSRVEQDPEDWLSAMARASRIVWAGDPGAAMSVVGVTVTAHMHALVCLGQEDRALGRALILGDQRAIVQASRVTDRLGAQEVYAITGAELDPSMPAAKIAWLRDESPEIVARTSRFLAAKDWIRHWLTGDLLTEPVDACATSLYDIRAGSWSERLVDAVGIQRDQLPDIVAPDAVAGTLRPQPASVLGLPAGLPVVVGAGDDVEVLGNGLLTTGRGLEHFGTTGSILTISDRFLLDPEMRLEVYPHVIPGLWVLGGSMTTAGAAIEWARELLGQPDVATVLRGATRFDAAPVFLPHLAGERIPQRAPHARGAWIGLDLSSDAQGLMRGALLGVAFGLRAILERIEFLVGTQSEISVSGGYGIEPDWLQLRADVYGRPLAMLETTEPTALGAMAVCQSALGLAPDLATAVRGLTRIADRVTPQAERARDLSALFARWSMFRSAFAGVWERAADSGLPAAELARNPAR